MHDFCGEIEYETDDGTVHSDICWHTHYKAPDEEYRKMLHDCLDEWLDKAKSTGYFWIGRPDELFWKDYHPELDASTNFGNGETR